MSKQKNIKENKAETTASTATTAIAPPKTKIGIIPVIILAVVSIALYINTLWNDYALDDSMVLIRNSFTQRGVSGIGDIFKYDTFTGFWVFTDNKAKARTERNQKIDDIVKKDINYEYDKQLIEVKPIIDAGTSKKVEAIINEYDDAISKEESNSVDRIVKEKRLLPGGRYRPMSLLTFAIEIELFGKDFYDENGRYVGKGCPAVNHAMNAIYYALTVVLLYLILVRLFPRKDGSWWFSIPFIATLIFAFHPIHTEVVANVKGRDEILTLLGSLAALWWSIKYIDSKKLYYLVLSGFALLCGLFSKENAIVFLAIVPITLYYFTNAKWKEIGKVMIPLAIASVAFLVVRGMVLGWEHTEQTQELMNDPFVNMNFSERNGTIFVTLLMYIKLLFCPHPLTFDYYPWQIPKTELTDGLALLSLAIYLALGIYAVYGMIKKKDIASYSILFFLIPLAPVCNIFFCVGTLMNERFAFISSIGFCLIVAWFFVEVLPRFLKNITMSKTITAIAGVVILCLFSLKTVSRNFVWENDTTLSIADVETSSESAKSNCMAGGRKLEYAQSIKNKAKGNVNDKGKKEINRALDESIAHLKKSNEIYGRYENKGVYSDAMNLLGNAYFERCDIENGDISNALISYMNIINVSPQHGIVNDNMKVVLSAIPRILNENKNHVKNDKDYNNAINSIVNTIEKLIIADDSVKNIMTQEMDSLLALNSQDKNNTERIKSIVYHIKLILEPRKLEAYQVLGILNGRNLGNTELAIQNFKKVFNSYKEAISNYGQEGDYGFFRNYNQENRDWETKLMYKYINTMLMDVPGRIKNITDLIKDIDNNHLESINNETRSLIKSLEDLLRVKPQCGEAYYVLGVLYGRELGDMEASIQCFEKAETCQFERNASYYKDLGVAYGISRNYEKSVIALEKAIKMDPEDDLMYTNLGYTYMNLGETAKGQGYINKGAELKQKKAEKGK